MFVTKKLKKVNKELDKKIVQEGTSLNQTLCAQYCTQGVPSNAQPKRKGKVAIWTICSAVVVAVVCVVVCVALFGGQSTQGPSPKPQYFAENERSSQISAQELPSDVSSRLNLQKFSVVSAYFVYDSPSGDTLYYAVQVQKNTIQHANENTQSTVFFVTNSNYTFKEEFEQEPQSVKLKNSTVVYCEIWQKQQQTLSSSTFGRVDGVDIPIYFRCEYSSTSSDDDTHLSYAGIFSPTGFVRELLDLN